MKWLLLETDTKSLSLWIYTVNHEEFTAHIATLKDPPRSLCDRIPLSELEIMLILGNNDRTQRRKEARRSRGFKNGKLWFFVALVLGSLFMLWLLVILMGGDENRPLPEVGVHWHANYSVSICGIKEDPFPISSGGVHTHSTSDPTIGDGIIHIHPKIPTEANENATLARFMAGTGSKLTDQSLKLPSGAEYRNGDNCPDGSGGQVFLKINGSFVPEISSYVPSDGDLIELGFD